MESELRAYLDEIVRARNAGFSPLEGSSGSSTAAWNASRAVSPEER